MVPDHSRTYQSKSFRNIPHSLRLRSIVSLLDTRLSSGDISFADFGCSNGYVTNILAQRFSVERPHGFEYEEEHLQKARQDYPHIAFASINLNSPTPSGSFDLVTCFETLEHVGELENALDHLLSSTRKGGLLVLSVPIEIGPRGLAKYLAKTVIYRSNYSTHFKELSDQNIAKDYLIALLRNNDISRFRDKRSRWGTHFGFDYRVIDRHLVQRGANFQALNRFTTRFYLVQT